MHKRSYTRRRASERQRLAELVAERFGSPYEALCEVTRKPSPLGPETTPAQRRDVLLSALPYHGRNQFTRQPETPTARLPSTEPGRGATP